MNFIEAFTQGGQTQLHKLRMLRQVVGTTLAVSLVSGLVCFLILSSRDYHWQDINTVLCYYWCKMRVQLTYLPDGFLSNGCFLGREISCSTMLSYPKYGPWVSTVIDSLYKKAYYSVLISGLTIAFLSVFWVWRGIKRRQPIFLKGATLGTPYQVRHLVKQQGSSSIEIANIPLPSGSECEHMMVTGTTGTGKSNVIHYLLHQVRALGHKAVIVDATGELLTRFYNPNTDKILNPLDLRSEGWSLWKECKEQADFDELAASLIVQNSSEQFWTQTARQLFATAALKLSKELVCSLERLLKILLRAPLKETVQFLEGTAVSSYVALESEKTSLSIRATLASSIKCLTLLEGREGKFAINEWMNESESDSWLFISSTPTQRESLKPLMSAWLSMAVKALLNLSPDQHRRIWFIIDELSSLNKLDILLPALAESRKYGGCFVLGFQDLSQLDEIYGVHPTRSLCSLTNTKLIFRANDNAVARRLSELLGEEEIMETRESISFGAHQMRDGVNLADHIKTKPLVSPSDIILLNNLEAYLKLSGNFPVTKIKFAYF